MIKKIIEFFSLNNIMEPTWVDYLEAFFQFFFLFTSAIFLGLLVWTIVLYVREKKKDPFSRKYLPRLLGFLFALLLSVIGLTLSLQWYYWFII